MVLFSGFIFEQHKFNYGECWVKDWGFVVRGKIEKKDKKENYLEYLIETKKKK